MNYRRIDQVTNAEKLYEMGLDALDNNDDDAAFSLMSQAAQEGFAKAQFELGLMYENGQGTGKDIARAGEWYLKAAGQGLAEAQFNYGYMLAAMEDEDQKAEGLEWMKKAAGQGDEAAIEYLNAMESEADKKKRIEEAQKQRKAFAAGVRKMPKIFVIMSSLTRLPYMAMAKDGKTYSVLCYETEEKAQEQIAKLQERRETATVQEISRNQIQPFFESLYVCGFNNALFTASTGIYPVSLMEIAKRKLPPKNVKVVENPKLLRAAMFYMQEFRRGPEGADAKVRQALDRVLVSHMAGAKYLLPCVETTTGGKKGMQFMVVALNPNQDKYLPVFTDKLAFQRFKSRHQVKMLILDFRQLSEFVLPGDAKGFLLNPADVSAPLPIDYIKKVVGAVNEKQA